MTIIAEVDTAQLAELVKQVQAGNEVLLTQGNRLVVANESGEIPCVALNIRSFTGHKVLTPVISQSELADDMFSRQ